MHNLFKFYVKFEKIANFVPFAYEKYAERTLIFAARTIILEYIAQLLDMDGAKFWNREWA